MRQVAAAELRSWLATDRGSVTIVDVREPWEFALCRLSGSKHIPLGELAERAAELDPARPTVVVCHHGVRSLHAAAYLEHLGFGDVVNLHGGIDGWARSVDPAMAIY